MAASQQFELKKKLSSLMIFLVLYYTDIAPNLFSSKSLQIGQSKSKLLPAWGRTKKYCGWERVKLSCINTIHEFGCSKSWKRRFFTVKIRRDDFCHDRLGLSKNKYWFRDKKVGRKRCKNWCGPITNAYRKQIEKSKFKLKNSNDRLQRQDTIQYLDLQHGRLQTITANIYRLAVEMVAS